MALSDLTARTHPRQSGLVPQLAVLVAAVVLGLALGVALLVADARSWSGATSSVGTVTGRNDTGVVVAAGGRTVTLHLARVPKPGTQIQVEVSPDGRARPTSYEQTLGKATRDGVGLTVLLTVVVQLYRYAVTRRPTTEPEGALEG
ncbi:MAG: hypothetical protein JWO12_3222 [Frankiales bacterium]|nr:hypothetical protein [Frankiales bacterium]